MEAKVARIHDLQDGEMREVVVGETKVLLVRLKGKFYAIGGECTHYGGPLAEGALSGHRVVCPWHQAVFDVMNGDLRSPRPWMPNRATRCGWRGTMLSSRSRRRRQTGVLPPWCGAILPTRGPW